MIGFYLKLDKIDSLKRFKGIPITRILNNKYLRIDLSKNTKLTYYLRNLVIFLTPSLFYQRRLKQRLASHTKFPNIQERVNYYNKLGHDFALNHSKSIQAFKKEPKKTYFFDLYKYLIYFNPDLRFSYLFGDVTTVPQEPSFVKSRPIQGDNNNAVVLNLNKVRHFIFVKDKRAFEAKKDLLMWRGKAHQAHRKAFLEKFYEHPLCNVGQIVKKKDKGKVPWQKEKLSLKEQLAYKFILAIEGNDVASNLKWIMSSNSIAFMVKPSYETWFMEGRLIPNYHYVLLEDDYSDLEAKINYYTTHTKEAKAIIANANAYVEQFKDQEQEDSIALMVIDKYFNHASQRKGEL